MKIAVDAMGGDYAPAEIVKGAVLASKMLAIEVILVGDPQRISGELKKTKLPIVAASQVIGMNEPPVQAVKQKKDASLNVAVSLVKEGKADAVVSAGNTGALMAAALFKLGRIAGVERPAIAATYPLPTGNLVLLDVGANTDCKPKHLQQFAEMGHKYAKYVLHINNPRIGLLNIGEEKEKGNELTREAWPLLKHSPINFIGNVESKEILQGKTDVVVCDGFVGNLILKFSESLASSVFGMLKDELAKGVLNKIGLAFLLPALLKMRKKVTSDDYGGAPLLGINGIVFKSHGRAKSRAIKNAIRQSAEAVKGNVLEKLRG
ncbi:phosphate acyltransferase PlsX [Candidatus Margulisiibacteriota bacterium]